MVEISLDTSKAVSNELATLAQTETKETDRKLIAQVFNSLNPDFWATARERSRLHKIEWQAKTNVLADIQIFNTYLAGIASQIADYGYLRNLDLVTTDKYMNLWQLHVFGERDFDNWFFSSPNDFPKLKVYVQKLDYLRLLVIAYVETYLLPDKAEADKLAGEAQPEQTLAATLA